MILLVTTSTAVESCVTSFVCLHLEDEGAMGIGGPSVVFPEGARVSGIGSVKEQVRDKYCQIESED